MFIYEVIDEVPCVLVLQGLFINTSFVKKLLEVGINIFQVKPVIRIPPNMADVLKIGGHANVLLLQLLLVHLLTSLASLVSPINLHSLKWSTSTFPTYIPSYTSILYTMLDSPIAMVHMSPLLLPACLSSLPPLPSLSQLRFHRLLENFCLCLICKVEPDLSIIALKCVEIRSRCLVPELVIDLLIKNEDSSIHIVNPYKIGSSEIVLDKADDPTGPLVPPVVVSWPLAPVHLSHRGGEGLASWSNQGNHHLVLLSREKHGWPVLGVVPQPLP